MNKKNFCKIIVILIVGLVGVGLIVRCITHGCGLRDVPLSARLLSDENPIRKSDSIQHCNVVSGEIISFATTTKEITIRTKDMPDDLIIYVYLSKRDLKTLNIGDNITVKGSIFYTGRKNYQFITVGYSSPFPPIWFHAKLLSVSYAPLVKEILSGGIDAILFRYS